MQKRLKRKPAMALKVAFIAVFSLTYSCIDSINTWYGFIPITIGICVSFLLGYYVLKYTNWGDED